MSQEHVVVCKHCAHIFRSPSELPKFKECPKCGSGNVMLAASPTGHPVMVRVDFADVIGYGVGAAAGGAGLTPTMSPVSAVRTGRSSQPPHGKLPPPPKPPGTGAPVASPTTTNSRRSVARMRSHSPACGGIHPHAHALNRGGKCDAVYRF